jgi:hypothetical protein
MTLDLLANSDSGSSSQDDITSESSPSFSVNGQVLGDIVTVTATKPGVAPVTCTYTVGAVSSCTLGILEDGNWSVAASVTDLAGNAGTTDALPVTIDTSAPSAPLAPDLVAGSDLGASSSDDLTSDSTPELSGGSVPDGSFVTMTASKPGSPSVSCSYVASPSVSSCELPALSDGDWSITAMVSDPAGNASPMGPALPVTIDTLAPSAPLAPVEDGAGTGRFTVPGIPSGTVVIIEGRNGSELLSCTYVAGSQSSCSLGEVGSGAWEITAVATDQAGNASPASLGLQIGTSTIGQEQSQLPITGASVPELVLWALTFIAMGSLLWRLSRRPMRS